jgi:hypothetical protein
MTIAALLASLFFAAAEAQETDTVGDTTAAVVSEAAVRKGANLRYRYGFLPAGILNTWYHTQEESVHSFPRPNISAHIMGAEFALEPAPASFLFWAEYWKVNWGDGYWDDREDGTPDYSDGDWLAPSKLGMVALGVNFGREFPVTDNGQDVWLGFVVGGGFGLGILTGEVDQWKPGYSTDFNSPPDCGAAMPAYNRKDLSPADSQLNLPPVGPILDLTVGMRLNIGDSANVRLEGGLHDLIFVGGSAGAIF